MNPLIEQQASDWLERQRAGLDPAAERALAGWLADPAHREAHDRLSAMAAVFHRARAKGAHTAIVAQLGARGRSRRRRIAALATACVLLSGLAGYRWSTPGGPAPELSVAAAGAFTPIQRLPDGSIVELRRGARLAVRFEPAARRVDLLAGEALFRVEQDPARPFVVSAEGVAIRAVGTAFHVRLAPTRVEVLVTEGRVRVEDAVRGGSLLPPAEGGTAGSPLLTAGQAVVVDLPGAATPAPAAAVAELAPEEIRARLAWRTPRFEFDGVALEQAAAKLNEFNRAQIVVADPALGGLRISGSFAPDDPETFVRLVSATFGLRVEARGRELRLSR